MFTGWTYVLAVLHLQLPDLLPVAPMELSQNNHDVGHKTDPRRRGAAGRPDGTDDDLGPGDHRSSTIPTSARSVAAPDPAPGDQQPQQGLRGARDEGVRERRHRRPRQPAGGGEGHPAGRGGAPRSRRRPQLRTPAGAGAVHHAVRARHGRDRPGLRPGRALRRSWSSRSSPRRRCSTTTSPTTRCPGTTHPGAAAPDLHGVERGAALEPGEHLHLPDHRRCPATRPAARRRSASPRRCRRTSRALATPAPWWTCWPPG